MTDTTTQALALYEACRAFEDATGAKVVPWWIEWTGSLFHIRDDGYNWCCNDEAALDILEACAWRAVREWGDRVALDRKNPNDLSGNVSWQRHGIGIHFDPKDFFGRGFPDLPTALLAVAAWVESRKEKA